MLTFFTTAKPFEGHSGVIQRNALKSWKLLYPDVEVILFGNENGAAETCVELGLRHEPQVERHESGLKRLDYMFFRAQQIARHDYLCYSNCDMIFFQDFYRAILSTGGWRKRFLMIGRRWDTDVTNPIDFVDPAWADAMRDLAKSTGRKQIPEFIDYFAFSRGLYDQIPPLVIGRSYWDWWFVGKALSSGAAVVDATASVLAVHQNHGYGYHPQGKQGTNEDAFALYNITVGGGRKQLRYTIDATHRLDALGRFKLTPFWVRPLYLTERTLQKFYWQANRVLIFKSCLPIWHFCLGATRPLRARLGLRSESSRRSHEEDSSGVGPPR